MPNEHGVRSGNNMPLRCLMWLVAVFVIGTVAGVLLNRNGVVAPQPGATLIGLLIFGEALIYLVLLLVPTNGIVPPARIVVVVLLAMGSRALIALLSMEAAVIAQYATKAPGLWLHFYAGQWLGATVQIVLMGLYLWLVREALEIPKTRKKRTTTQRAAQTDYMREFRVPMQPDDEETRQRQDHLLTALMDNPDTPPAPICAETTELLRSVGVDIPASAEAPPAAEPLTRAPMPTYGETETEAPTTAETTVVEAKMAETSDAVCVPDILMGTHETAEDLDEPPMPAFLMRDHTQHPALAQDDAQAEEAHIEQDEKSDTEEIANQLTELAHEHTDQMAPVVDPLVFATDESATTGDVAETRGEAEVAEVTEETQMLLASEDSPTGSQGQLPLVQPEDTKEKQAAAPTFAELIAVDPAATTDERASVAVVADELDTGEQEIAESVPAISKLSTAQETTLKNAAATVMATEALATAISATNRVYGIIGIGSALGDSPSDNAILRSLDALMAASEDVMSAVHSGTPGSIIIMGAASSLVAAVSEDCGSQLIVRSDANKKLGQLSMIARKSKAATETLALANDFKAEASAYEELAPYEEASVQVKRRTGYDAFVFSGNGRNVITLAPPADAAQIAAASERAYEAAASAATALKLGTVQRVLIEGQETGLVIGPFSADADVLIASYAESTSKMGAANVTLGKFDASLRGEA